MSLKSHDCDWVLSAHLVIMMSQWAMITWLGFQTFPARFPQAKPVGKPIVSWKLLPLLRIPNCCCSPKLSVEYLFVHFRLNLGLLNLTEWRKEFVVKRQRYKEERTKQHFVIKCNSILVHQCNYVFNIVNKQIAAALELSVTVTGKTGRYQWHRLFWNHKE